MRRYGQTERRRCPRRHFVCPSGLRVNCPPSVGALFTLAREKAICSLCLLHFPDAPPSGGDGRSRRPLQAELARSDANDNRSEVSHMAELVLNTNTLPEPLFRLIKAEKVKVNEA
ncbi:MAG: hypothetical protein FWH55_02050, partial [Oscillospiraceae bacterium]|nr:hypothetical protein [Oscillospiraceae bacterium]